MPRPYSAAVRERVLAEVAMRDLQPAKSSRVESIATIAYRFRISESTVRRWIQQEKDETAKLYGRAVKREPKPRGRPRKLSAAETRAIVDFVERSRANWDPVTIATVRQFAAQSLGRALSPSYVSRMLRREGYTSQKTQKRPASRVRATYDQEVKEFREKWGIHPLLSSMFLVMDESGIWNDSVVARTYASAGSRSAGVACTDKASRDTVVATLRMDGHKLPLFYIRHSRQQTKQKAVVKRAVKGMTEELMLEYIQEILKPNTFPGMYIFMDQLSSHKTARVRQALSSIGLNVIYFPPKTAPDLSPCDNFFFLRCLRGSFERRTAPRQRGRNWPRLKLMLKSLRRLFAHVGASVNWCERMFQ